MAENQEVVIVGGVRACRPDIGIVLATRRAAATVTLLDVDAGRVESVNNGRMPFMEAGAHGLLKQVAGKTLCATLDIGCLRTADIVITVLGTPVDEHLNPTVTALYRNVDELLQYMKRHSPGKPASSASLNQP